MYYPFNKEKAKELDEFMTYMINIQGDYRMNLNAKQIELLDLIKSHKPELILEGEEVMITAMGKNYISNGGFTRELNAHKIQSEKENKIMELSIQEKAQNVFSKPIVIIVSIISLLYTFIDIIKRSIEFFKH